MPSVVNKPQENGASSVTETSIQAAIAVVEKKVRNLEKRKGKLDSYRDLLKRGKPLNEDQQAAVDKYEEVISTLDFTKELMGQFTKLAQDDARDKKKMAKKEQLERAKEELSKVTYIMAVKEILSTILEEGVASDLKSGAAGAPKLSEEQLLQLQQFAQLVTPDREVKDKGSFDKQVNSSAEHLINLADKKSRTVVGTTYVELNSLICTIRESGYIEAKWARESAANTEADVAAEADYDTQDTQDEDDETMPETEPINEKVETTNGHAMLGHDDSQNDEPMPVFPSPPQQQHNQQQIPTEASPQHIQHQPQQQQIQQPVQQQVPVPEPSFNFLQESQIDLESPHMDPAVVMVRPAAKRPPGNVQAHPPGMQAMVDQSRQMLQQFQIHQQQQQQQQILLAAQQQQQQQQQQVMATTADTKFSSSRNSAFDAPIKPGTGPAPGMANGLSGPQTGAPPFTQTSPADRQAPNTDPRAPRVPDGTPQHSDPSPNKPPVYNSVAPIQPSGYAAAAGGSTNANVKQADTEIGTWRPEGATNGDDEDEDGRHGGDKSRRGRGGGGRGFGGGRRGDGRGYSRGRGDGGDRGYRGGRGGGRDRRQYDDRDRRDDRPRGSGGRGGGFRGRGGPRGGQNGYRE